MSPERARAAIELGAALLTGMVFVALPESGAWKGPFIGVTCVVWAAYWVIAARRRPGLLREWGLWPARALEGGAAAGLVLAVGAAALAAVGAVRGTLDWSTHLGLSLLLYPLWGLVQQFLLQVLGARNLETLTGSRTAAWLGAAVLFSLIHAPEWELCAGTLLLALITIPLFRRSPSLYPLALLHGWLGALAYYWVLDKDPWAQVFG